MGILFGRKRLQDYSEEIIEWCKKYTPSSDPIRIVIGYSMGGLIARYIAKRLPSVQKLILVSTPNLGINKPARWKRLLLWRVKCVKDTLPKSAFLEKLNSELPLNCKVYLIGGSKDEVVSLDSTLGITALPENHKVILPLGHSELIPLPDSKDQGAIEKIIQFCKDP